MRHLSWIKDELRDTDKISISYINNEGDLVSIVESTEPENIYLSDIRATLAKDLPKDSTSNFGDNVDSLASAYNNTTTHNMTDLEKRVLYLTNKIVDTNMVEKASSSLGTLALKNVHCTLASLDHSDIISSVALKLFSNIKGANYFPFKGLSYDLEFDARNSSKEDGSANFLRQLTPQFFNIAVYPEVKNHAVVPIGGIDTATTDNGGVIYFKGSLSGLIHPDTLKYVDQKKLNSNPTVDNSLPNPLEIHRRFIK